MTEIEIDVKAKIFDDPEYCQSEVHGSERCRFIAFNWDEQYKYCPVFDNAKLREFDLPGDPWGLGTEKCSQCKEAWKTKKDEILT